MKTTVWIRGLKAHQGEGMQQVKSGQAKPVGPIDPPVKNRGEKLASNILVERYDPVP